MSEQVNMAAHYEHEIPEGYEARIEGNKVIIELKESEDERIRKEIIDYFYGCIRRNSKSGFRLEQYKSWIAYLKKQKDVLGERAKSITASMLEDRIEGIQRELIEFLSNTVNASWLDIRRSADAYAERIRNIIEKQKEQKPAEWRPLPESMEALLLAIEGKWDAIKPTGYMSRRLEDLYDGLVNTFDVDEKYLGNLPKTEYTEKDIEEIKALKEKIDSSMETKPAEWSEEDKAMIERLIRHTQKEFDELCNDRYGHQEIISDLKESCRERMTWLENRLKSLRPQPHWKPSEEQMEALRIAYEIGTANESWAMSVLKSLRDDLLKL